MLKHRHHKIPTHAGGTDSPDNIELLTVAEHAEAHRLLYETHGRVEDKLAWKGLAGIISKSELVHELQRLGGHKAVAANQPWKKPTSANWKLNTKNQEYATAQASTPEAVAKRKNTYASINHQQGDTNSAFGTSIYRDADGDRRRFVRGDQPVGWILSSEWIENKKCKKNGTYGKRWYNDSTTNFLLAITDERTKNLKLGRLNPGFQ